MNHTPLCMAPTRTARQREAEQNYPHLQPEEVYRPTDSRPPTLEHVYDPKPPSLILPEFEKFERRVCDRCSDVSRHPAWLPYRGYCPNCDAVTARTPLLTAFGRTAPTGGWLGEREGHPTDAE